jgi:hypothetical protein
LSSGAYEEQASSDALYPDNVNGVARGLNQYKKKSVTI